MRYIWQASLQSVTCNIIVYHRWMCEKIICLWFEILNILYCSVDRLIAEETMIYCYIWQMDREYVGIISVAMWHFLPVLRVHIWTGVKLPIGWVELG